MLSLDMNAEILTKHGNELIKEWNENLDYFYDCARSIDGLKLVGTTPVGRASAEGFGSFDRSKLILDMTEAEFTGHDIYYSLMEEGIYLELANSSFSLAMTGIGNTRLDYEKLLSALEKVHKAPLGVDMAWITR